MAINIKARLHLAVNTGLKKGWKNFLWMAKITVPISLIVALLKWTGWLYEINFILDPVMRLLQLPSEAAFPILSGLVINIYAAVERHRDALYRVCCAYVREEADRQDIYQEVLIHIWQSLGTFRGQSNLGTWLYRVAVNTCLGWLRREQRRSRMLGRAWAERPAEATRVEHGSLGAVEEDVQRLYGCIARLAPVDRLLISHYLEEMESAEIGAVLGIWEGNVGVKLHRIKNQLRDMMEKDNYEPR